ncbi:MAG: hypothetical protein LBV80_04545 [Deltaproteobacteria bacterium]|jgi:hypothetical protein|nr:hypothetical protein [Deltaproteobacteria bacterium]
MIPCFICGQPAETDWVMGLPPAPDSQKLGLCNEHNNQENRSKVNRAWQGYLTAAIGELNRSNAQRAAGMPRLLSIFFSGGGSLSVPCLEYSTPDPDILKVLTPEGEAVFFPLRQVRHYSVGPLGEAPQATQTDNSQNPPGLAQTGDRQNQPALPLAENRQDLPSLPQNEKLQLPS